MTSESDRWYDDAATSAAATPVTVTAAGTSHLGVTMLGTITASPQVDVSVPTPSAGATASRDSIGYSTPMSARPRRRDSLPAR